MTYTTIATVSLGFCLVRAATNFFFFFFFFFFFSPLEFMRTIGKSYEIFCFLELGENRNTAEVYLAAVGGAAPHCLVHGQVWNPASKFDYFAAHFGLYRSACHTI